MNTLSTLAKCIGKYKKESLLTPLCTALEVLMEVLIPFVTASLIDKGIQAGNLKAVWGYGLLMLVLAFCSLACGFLSGKFAAIACTGFAANVRDAMYRKIQDYSFSNIDKYSTAGLITRMTTDVSNVQNSYMMLIRIAVRPPLMLICSVFMCFSISPSMSMIFVVAVIFLSFFLIMILTRATKYFSATFEKYDELNGSVQENVSASRVVKSFVREDYETEKFTAAANNIRRMFEKAEGIVVFNNPIMMLTVYACIIAMSWFGAHQITAGTLTTGNLTSLMSYIMSIMMSLMMLSMVFVMISISTAGAKRVAAVLNEEPDIVNCADPVKEVKDGSIDFDHVSFSYSSGTGDNVLNDINLSIRSGETIGMIGGTGSGKSTLISLISRLYDAKEGSVRVGGVNVKDYDIETLRNNVSVVLQSNVLFSGTVLENLRWGKQDATLEEAMDACHLACADEFIERKEDGYQSRVEQGGANFSGGQKQRLCIARALLKKPKILILDDSTSAVDTAMDASIRTSFRERIPDTTKIIIAQRIASVKDADRIIVIDNGAISGFDTHENLMNSNQIYREIYEAQNRAGGDFDAPARD